jgi:hypothetical protein
MLRFAGAGALLSPGTVLVRSDSTRAGLVRGWSMAATPSGRLRSRPPPTQSRGRGPAGAATTMAPRLPSFRRRIARHYAATYGQTWQPFGPFRHLLRRRLRAVRLRPEPIFTEHERRPRSRAQMAAPHLPFATPSGPRPLRVGTSRRARRHAARRHVRCGLVTAARAHPPRKPRSHRLPQARNQVMAACSMCICQG